MMGEEVTWVMVACAEAAIIVGFGTVIWTNVASTLKDVADKLGEVATLVHGHEIRLDHIERGHGGK